MNQTPWEHFVFKTLKKFIQNIEYFSMIDRCGVNLRQNFPFMNRSLKLCVASCFLLFLVSGAFAAEVWRNAEHGISFVPPNGWSTTSVGEGGELGLWESPDGGAEISVSVSDCEKKPEELDEFLGELALSCSGESGKVVESKKLPLGTRELGVVVIRSEQLGCEMMTHTSVVLAHNKVYYVTGICHAYAYPELKGAIESSSRSLVVE